MNDYLLAKSTYPKALFNFVKSHRLTHILPMPVAESSIEAPSRKGGVQKIVRSLEERRATHEVNTTLPMYTEQLLSARLSSDLLEDC